MDIISKEYAIAYAEVTEILSHVADEDIQKLPKDKVDFYKENMDKEYDYSVDPNIDLKQQQMTDITKAILANLFRDYWATDYQRERIIAKEKYDMQKAEEEKMKKYDPNNIFKKDEPKEEIVSSENLEESTKENLPIEIKQENFFQKLISFIKGLFNKNKF